MRILGISRNTRISKKSASQAQGTFSLELSDSVGAENAQIATGPAALTSLSSLDTILALQSVEDEPIATKIAAGGHNALDKLEKLSLALLDGGVSQEQLEQLRHLDFEAARNADDPKLKSIMRDIEIRVAVEIAKLSRRL